MKIASTILLKYLEEYLDRILFISYINRFLPLGIAILMAIVPILMLRRYLRYKKQMKENQKIENNSKEIKEETINNDTKIEQV